VAKKLRGFLYFAGEGADVAEAITYRANFGEREMMMIWPNWAASFAGDAVAAPWACAPGSMPTRAGTRPSPNVPVTG
jgi:phage tail sheath protein FI